MYLNMCGRHWHVLHRWWPWYSSSRVAKESGCLLYSERHERAAERKSSLPLIALLGKRDENTFWNLKNLQRGLLVPWGKRSFGKVMMISVVVLVGDLFDCSVDLQLSDHQPCIMSWNKVEHTKKTFCVKLAKPAGCFIYLTPVRVVMYPYENNSS